ncbi:MAG: RNA polymerase sigma factor [Armatimonadota bacterium]
MVDTKATCEGAVDVSQNITDEELTCRFRSGEIDAFRLLHSRHEARLYRYAYLMTGSREDARDIVQESFIRAYKALPNFRGDSTFATWLMRICTNLCRSHARLARLRLLKLSLLAALTDQKTEEDRSDPAVCTERQFELDALRSALLRLPSHQRELIVLHEYEGLNMDEIARLQCSTPGSVRVRLFRARNRLKETTLDMFERRQ